MTDNQENPDVVNDLINNLFRIFRVAGAKCGILDEKFPAKFHESDPLKLFESYTKFLKQRSDVDGSIKNEDNLPMTTITERHENNEYDPSNGGLYKLYHDMKLVCIMLIHYYPQGSKKYQMIDKFYKFATELILREAYQLGAQLVYESPLEEEENELLRKDKNELEKAIGADFIKIATNYTVPVTETYHISTKDMELFSSIIERSEIDYRPHELPNSNFEINKIIPQTNVSEEAPRLGFLAANTSGIPDPTLPPTEMMANFLHPNWYALPTTVWLKYNDFSSWAPAFNENGTVLGSTKKGIIWLYRVGYLQELKKKRESIENEKREDIKHLEGRNGKDIEVTADIGEIKSENEKIGEPKENDKEDDNKGDFDNKPIKIENLFGWSPNNQLDRSDIEMIKNGKCNDLLDSTIKSINDLRTKRIMKRISEPSEEERKLYFKSRLILKEIMLVKKEEKLNLSRHNSFPIIQVNYNGSIPVVRTQPVKKKKYKR
ncbi:Chromatin structure-remodeling complex protein RSC58 [Nakaseomyces bracarensis]|uniref:Chromatin structure-remodeling complex protein RSC58 n=1 Tax=Nakaseomyces bracarensis TaxID=273131 RepID=A0ABR4NVN7_9SACH